MKYDELEQSTQVILKVIFAGIALAFFWLVRDILLLLLLSVLLASAMDPMVDYFNRRKVPRAVSVLTVYVVVLGIAGLLLALIIPPVIAQLKVLADSWPEYAVSFESRWGFTFLRGVELQDLISGIVRSGSEDGRSVLTSTFGVFNGLFSVITVLVISFYLVAEERGMKNFIADLIPAQHQEFTMGLVEKIQQKMGLWIIGQVILSFAIFGLTLIGLTLIGIPNALLLAALAGLLEVLPYIGPFLSAIPAVFFAFLISPAHALAVALMYLLVQKLEGYVLVPKIMQKTVGTSPLVVLVALLVGFKLAGIVGLLIAVPLVGAITVVVREFLASKQSATAPPI